MQSLFTQFSKKAAKMRPFTFYDLLFEMFQNLSEDYFQERGVQVMQGESHLRDSLWNDFLSRHPLVPRLAEFSQQKAFPDLSKSPLVGKFKMLFANLHRVKISLFKAVPNLEECFIRLAVDIFSKSESIDFLDDHVLLVADGLSLVDSPILDLLSFYAFKRMSDMLVSLDLFEEFFRHLEIHLSEVVKYHIELSKKINKDDLPNFHIFSDFENPWKVFVNLHQFLEEFLFLPSDYLYLLCQLRKVSSLSEETDLTFNSLGSLLAINVQILSHFVRMMQSPSFIDFNSDSSEENEKAHFYKSIKLKLIFEYSENKLFHINKLIKEIKIESIVNQLNQMKLELEKLISN